MPKTAAQKTRILSLLDILKTRTDETHFMTVAELSSALAANGIDAERKTILDDLHALEEYGFPLENRRGRGGGFYLAGRIFELAELKLLVDAVQSSKFISEKKSRTLIDKLCTLASNHEARTLIRQVYVSGRVKTENPAALYAVDAIHTAIAAHHQITFRYNEWTVEKKLRPRHGGALYRISPYLLAWEDGNYYLVGYDDEKKEQKHFRVDKMTDVTVTDEMRQGEDKYARFDPAAFTKETFGMYGGEEELVTLECDNALIGVVLDRFGDRATIRKASDSSFRVSVRVRVSPVFLSWVVGFGGRMKIVAPLQTAKALRALALAALEAPLPEE